MNSPLARFCLMRFKGNLLTNNCKFLTYSVISHLRCASTKYAVFEQKQKYQKKESKKVKEKIDTDSFNHSLVVKKLLTQETQAHSSPASSSPSQGSSQLKCRLEYLNVSVDETLSEMDKTINNSVDLKESDTSVSSVDLNAVESVGFLSDLKASIPIKPSPLLGTEDRNVPPSKVPCVGCGATLHCQHRTFPGFLPSEYFKILSPDDMRTTLCQRCFYIQNCDAFQEVSTNPAEFSELISKIKSTKSVVVIVVDVIDIQGSIIPNLMNFIGDKHPVIVVGNKADLLSPDSPEYLKNVTVNLKNQCYKAGIRNIKKCTLISAKTGFGIERLITTLFGFYKHQVDVYIVGSANAGKSSLFNTLLASDYCKHTARDLIQRATISVWPGTTLNLLKFPIMRPSSRTNALRVIRLKQKEAQIMAERESKMQKNVKTEKNATWELRDEVEMTDVRTATQFNADETGAAWGQEIGGFIRKGGDTIAMVKGPEKSGPFKPESYTESYWAYDTPGLINPTQIMNLLTPEEAPYIAPKTMLVPQCVLLNPGNTLYISGMSRLDYIEGDSPLVFTVHCGPMLPIVVIPTQEADQFYMDSVGTEKLGIPLGDKDRLLRLPSLCGVEFIVKGIKPNLSSSDIQLSSLGWVSVAPKVDQYIKVRAYTPGGVGIYQRNPSLLPNDAVYRGRRIWGTPFFETRPPGWIMAKGNAQAIKS